MSIIYSHTWHNIIYTWNHTLHSMYVELIYSCWYNFIESIFPFLDPYVRIEFSQPNRSPHRKQTRTRKKSPNPVLKETFLFTVSPKSEDIRYTTLTFTVMAHDKARTDEAIGQVRMGYGASESTAYHQWNQIIQQPEVEITNWHYLVDPDEICKWT